MTETELDVRPLPKPERHPRIFAAFDALEVGQSFVLISNHEPKPLRHEFEVDYPGGFGWEYDQRGPDRWRVRIRKLTASPLPRVLVDTSQAHQVAPEARGAVWRLEMSRRQLDANLVRLPPDERIDSHLGPDHDVLVHVVEGSGHLGTERDPVPLTAGAVVWLPRRSRREIAAGPDGLTYLTVHPRRSGLSIAPAPPA